MKIGDIVLAVRYAGVNFDECVESGLQPVIIGKVSYITDDELFVTVTNKSGEHVCWCDELVLLKGGRTMKQYHVLLKFKNGNELMLKDMSYDETMWLKVSFATRDNSKLDGYKDYRFFLADVDYMQVMEVSNETVS